MEKVRPWCGQPSDRGQLKNRTEHIRNESVPIQLPQCRFPGADQWRFHAWAGVGTDPFQIVAKKVAHSRLPSLPGLIPVLGSQPAGDVIHKPGGRLPLLSTRPFLRCIALSYFAIRLESRKSVNKRIYLSI